jgi:outer membrane protein assembly factor BamB
MNSITILLSILLSITSVTITEPADGETYDGDWLMLNAIVENDNEIPDSVSYQLNGEIPVAIERLNTDWYTYMANDIHTGYSVSPAPMDNSILWTAQVTGTEHEFPTPVVVEGMLYYPQNEGGDTLFALNTATGEVKWMFTGTGSTDDAVTVKQGSVYIACDSIVCLDALNGTVKWSSGEGDWSGSTPVVSGGRVYCGVALSADSSMVICLDALTGDLIWNKRIAGMIASCMTVWEDKLFVPSSSLYSTPPEEYLLFAMNISDGTIIWEDNDSYRGYWDSSPVIVDGTVYIGGVDGRLRAFNAETGEIQWKTFFANDVITATPAYHSDRIYAGAQYSTFASVNSINGSFIWTQDYMIHGSPAIAENTVFFGEYSFNDSARVIALDCLSGDTVWTYMTKANRFQGSPSIVDGILYIPAIDGNLYAFGTGLEYTYREYYFYAEVGSNELIVTSWDDGIAVAADTINFTVTQTGITLEPSSQLHLSADPNPFCGSTSISFELAESGPVSLQVFDLTGRLVVDLSDPHALQGPNTLHWDGSGDNGEIVPAGLYICRIESRGVIETTGLCVLR